MLTMDTTNKPGIAWGFHVPVDLTVYLVTRYIQSLWLHTVFNYVEIKKYKEKNNHFLFSVFFLIAKILILHPDNSKGDHLLFMNLSFSTCSVMLWEAVYMYAVCCFMKLYICMQCTDLWICIYVCSMMLWEAAWCRTIPEQCVC